jgi:anti-sigma regulatory factor (Ser/Thr protein kinase)
VTTAEVALPGDPRSAGAARKFLADTLASWGCADFEFAAVLLLSELVTNAVLHARTDVVVRISRLAGALRLEVGDQSPRTPIPRHYSRDATTGRGLALVDSLARDWGVDADHEGKVVWCELVEPAADDGPSEHLVIPLADLEGRGDGVAGSVAPGRDRNDPRALAA